MKIFYILALFLLSLFFLGCKSEPTSPSGNLDITGRVMFNGQPVQNAVVEIDKVSKWTALSNSDGYFEITNVTKGEHNVVITRTFENNKTAVRNSKINFTTSTDIGVTNLPPLTNMEPIEIPNLFPAAIPLKWSPAEGDNFLEYKIYRRDSSDVDEFFSELVYSSGSKQDTVFEDPTFRTGKNNYYRIYTFYNNDLQSLSNVVSAYVSEVNFIENSSMEVSDSTGITPLKWNQKISGFPVFNYFTLSDQEVRDGSKSLLVTYLDSLANPDPGYNPWGGLSQDIPANSLVPERIYTLSFWTKSDKGIFQVRLLKNGELADPIINYLVLSEQKWVKTSFDFKIDNNLDKIQLLISTGRGQASDGIVKGWIDDIKIIK